MLDENSKPIVEFGADKIKISGPRVDGSYNISFETGEYERNKIAELIKIEPPVMVSVKLYDEDKW